MSLAEKIADTYEKHREDKTVNRERLSNWLHDRFEDIGRKEDIVLCLDGSEDSVMVRGLEYVFHTPWPDKQSRKEARQDFRKELPEHSYWHILSPGKARVHLPLGYTGYMRSYLLVMKRTGGEWVKPFDGDIGDWKAYALMGGRKRTKAETFTSPSQGTAEEAIKETLDCLIHTLQEEYPRNLNQLKDSLCE